MRLTPLPRSRRARLRSLPRPLRPKPSWLLVPVRPARPVQRRAARTARRQARPRARARRRLPTPRSRAFPVMARGPDVLRTRSSASCLSVEFRLGMVVKCCFVRVWGLACGWFWAWRGSASPLMSPCRWGAGWACIGAQGFHGIEGGGQQHLGLCSIRLTPNRSRGRPLPALGLL